MTTPFVFVAPTTAHTHSFALTRVVVPAHSGYKALLAIAMRGERESGIFS